MSENIELKDTQVENIMGNLLRIGVLASAIIVFIGGIFYLVKYGTIFPEYSAFRSEPEKLRDFSGIFKEAFVLHSSGIIQFGLLVLIATPIARVIFAIIAFSIERDIIYVVISTIVLIVLLISFFNII